jgi:hypothetical protein
LNMIFCRILILQPKLLPRCLWVYHCFIDSVNICYYICISWRMWFLNSIVNFWIESFTHIYCCFVRKSTCNILDYVTFMIMLMEVFLFAFVGLVMIASTCSLSR